MLFNPFVHNERANREVQPSSLLFELLLCPTFHSSIAFSQSSSCFDNRLISTHLDDTLVTYRSNSSCTSKNKGEQENTNFLVTLLVLCSSFYVLTNSISLLYFSLEVICFFSPTWIICLLGCFLSVETLFLWTFTSYHLVGSSIRLRINHGCGENESIGHQTNLSFPGLAFSAAQASQINGRRYIAL
jgi:hypothetical protein